MTPHESHIIGRVAGEARCVTCHVAPDWPLIEEPCDLTVLSQTGRRERKAALRRERDGRQSLERGSCRPEERRPQMTIADMHRVSEMRAAGETWSTIARVLGRSRSCVRDAHVAWCAGEGRLAQRERRSA